MKATPLAEAAEAKSGKDDSENDPKDYEVDSAMETLLRAEEHKKNPKLMKKVHQKLGLKKKAITSIQGLRDKKQALVNGEEDGYG